MQGVIESNREQKGYLEEQRQVRGYNKEEGRKVEDINREIEAKRNEVC